MSVRVHVQERAGLEAQGLNGRPSSGRGFIGLNAGPRHAGSHGSPATIAPRATASGSAPDDSRCVESHTGSGGAAQVWSGVARRPFSGSRMRRGAWGTLFGSTALRPRDSNQLGTPSRGGASARPRAWPARHPGRPIGARCPTRSCLHARCPAGSPLAHGLPVPACGREGRPGRGRHERWGVDARLSGCLGRGSVTAPGRQRDAARRLRGPWARRRRSGPSRTRGSRRGGPAPGASLPRCAPAGRSRSGRCR